MSVLRSTEISSLFPIETYNVQESYFQAAETGELDLSPIETVMAAIAMNGHTVDAETLTTYLDHFSIVGHTDTRSFEKETSELLSEQEGLQRYALFTKEQQPHLNSLFKRVLEQQLRGKLIERGLDDMSLKLLIIICDSAEAMRLSPKLLRNWITEMAMAHNSDPTQEFPLTDGSLSAILVMVSGGVPILQ